MKRTGWDCNKIDRRNVCILQFLKVLAKSLHKEAGGIWSSDTEESVGNSINFVDMLVLVPEVKKKLNSDIKAYNNLAGITLEEFKLVGFILMAAQIRFMHLVHSERTEAEPLKVLAASKEASREMFGDEVECLVTEYMNYLGYCEQSNLSESFFLSYGFIHCLNGFVESPPLFYGCAYWVVTIPILVVLQPLFHKLLYRHWSFPPSSGSCNVMESPLRTPFSSRVPSIKFFGKIDGGDTAGDMSFFKADVRFIKAGYKDGQEDGGWGTALAKRDGSSSGTSTMTVGGDAFWIRKIFRSLGAMAAAVTDLLIANMMFPMLSKGGYMVWLGSSVYYYNIGKCIGFLSYTFYPNIS